MLDEFDGCLVLKDGTLIDQQGENERVLTKEVQVQVCATIGGIRNRKLKFSILCSFIQTHRFGCTLYWWHEPKNVYGDGCGGLAIGNLRLREWM